jgi:hypothetical protein
MSAFSTLFLPFEVSVGAVAVSSSHYLEFPWHFTVFKALSEPLSYLIPTTTPEVGRAGIFVPISQIRNLGLRELEIYPKVTGPLNYRSLQCLPQVSFHQLHLLDLLPFGGSGIGKLRKLA